MAISRISASKLSSMKRKSAYSLPDSPTSAGISAEHIKDSFWKFALDDHDSLASEIDRVIDEANVDISAKEDSSNKGVVISSNESNTTKFPSAKDVADYVKDYAEPELTKKSAFNKDFETTVSNIKESGTASVGTLDTISRADHVHPKSKGEIFAVEEESKSRNLFYGYASSSTNYGVSVLFDETNQLFTVSGTSTASVDFALTPMKPIVFKANTTYHISIFDADNQPITLSRSLLLYNSETGKYTTPNISYFTSHKSFSFSSDSTINRIGISCPVNAEISCIFKIMIEEGDERTNYTNYNGKLLHENDFDDLSRNYLMVQFGRTEKKINVSNLSYTTGVQFYNYFVENANMELFANIGNASSNNFKTVFGTPSGFGNYVDCYIRRIKLTSSTEQQIFEFFANDSYQGKYAVAYLNSGTVNGTQQLYFSGWHVI